MDHWRSCPPIMISHVIFAKPTALRVTMAAIIMVSSTISSYLNDNHVNNNASGGVIYLTADDSNKTAIVVVSGGAIGLGVALGDPCTEHCSKNLTHAVCNETTGRCECELAHPIRLDSFICIPALHLGDICNYEESCLFHDANARCWRESPYYSKCACKSAYMAVENRAAVLSGETRRWHKCVRDPYTHVQYDLSAILGIGVGLSLFTGVTCLMLKLFSRARFGDPGGHYADANQSPPMLMTPVSGQPSRRSSGRSQGARRPSYYSTLAPASRPGSRRPSLVSVRSQSSIRSYGGRYDHIASGHGRHQHYHPDHHHHPKQHQQHGHGQGHHHEPLRASVSAPIGVGECGAEELGSPSGSSIVSVRMLEQRFAQHASYHPRREDRETSRHNSQEIITEVISESPEKLFK